MQNDDRLDRAKQFMPFDALKGFREALLEKEKIMDSKVLLSEEQFNYLNDVILSIDIGSTILVTFYSNNKYIDKIFTIKKLSIDKNKIVLNDYKILLSDIKNIKIIN
jgi:hypothetical protein